MRLCVHWNPWGCNDRLAPAVARRHRPIQTHGTRTPPCSPKRQGSRIQTVINIFHVYTTQIGPQTGLKEFGALKLRIPPVTMKACSLHCQTSHLQAASLQWQGNSDNWCETSKTATTCPGNPRVKGKNFQPRLEGWCVKTFCTHVPTMKFSWQYTNYEMFLPNASSADAQCHIWLQSLKPVATSSRLLPLDTGMRTRPVPASQTVGASEWKRWAGPPAAHAGILNTIHGWWIFAKISLLVKARSQGADWYIWKSSNTCRHGASEPVPF